jgi:glucose-6-phosphate isomerase
MYSLLQGFKYVVVAFLTCFILFMGIQRWNSGQKNQSSTVRSEMPCDSHLYADEAKPGTKNTPDDYLETWKDPFLNSPSFEKAKSTARLSELALHAPDLSVPGFLTWNRIDSFSTQGANLLFLYGFEQINQQIVDELQALADERKVVDQMRAMYAGKPINFIQGCESEQKQVLHAASRDVFRRNLVQNAHEKLLVETELRKLRVFFETLPPSFETLLVIGIGSSELGPHALAEALAPYYLPNRSVRYVANMDPDALTEALKGLDFKKTLVAVISKSGATLETTANESRARAFFEKAGLKPEEHFVAVTSPKTAMDDPSKYRAVFHMSDFVGGRFSSTSVVGGLVISFLTGVDNFYVMLDGANQMDCLSINRNIQDNPPLLLALLGIWNRNFLNYPSLAIIPYSSLLQKFPFHIQQCDMESNGKGINRLGQRVPFATAPIILGETGTNAQHTLFQLLHQGTDVVPIEFIGFKEPSNHKDFLYEGTSSQDKLLCNMFAQALALAIGKRDELPNKSFSGNRPSLIILGTKLDPRTLGSLLSLYENKIAFQGFLWGINSFDQEAVQLGKILADDLLAIKRSQNEQSEELSLSPIGRRLFELMEGGSTSKRPKINLSPYGRRLFELLDDFPQPEGGTPSSGTVPEKAGL